MIFQEEQQKIAQDQLEQVPKFQDQQTGDKEISEQPKFKIEESLKKVSISSNDNKNNNSLIY